MAHICHITTAHQVFDNRIFQRECVSLAQLGYQVSLIAVHSCAEVSRGVQIVPLPKPRTILERRLILTDLAARTALRMNADLYHFHDPELIPAMRWLARKTGKPVVWDAHENFVSSIQHFNQFGLYPLSIMGASFFGFIEKLACQNDFAAVVTITDIMADRYREWGIRAIALGNFADLQAITYPPTSSKSQRPRLASSGAQHADRGIFEIAAAFREIWKKRPIELAFWGSFSPENLRDELRKEALSDGASADDLIIGGPYPWNILVGELIPTAWLGFVLFNPKNMNNRVGLPNRFFEYWANSVPVIATAGTEVARLVTENGGGVVVQDNNPRQIAYLVTQLIANPGQIDQMGKSGRLAVEKKYNQVQAIKQLVSLYVDLGVHPAQIF